MYFPLVVNEDVCDSSGGSGGLLAVDTDLSWVFGRDRVDMSYFACTNKATLGSDLYCCSTPSVCATNLRYSQS